MNEITWDYKQYTTKNIILITDRATDTAFPKLVGLYFEHFC